LSFLYPLFLAGITAISVPIILHLIRRHTRKRVTFSSLMFLRTTIPRFKSRSRLENLPLLILRCLILVLLALVFSRPFFVRPVSGEPNTAGRRIVLLIDTSASMRRAGMWTQAVNDVRSILNDLESADRVSVMSFDQNTSTLIGFDGWSKLDPVSRAATVLENISELSPSWASTNLGNALVSAAETIEDDEINDQQQVLNQCRIVLISDLQQGANLDALHTYQWPQEIELVVKLIKARGNTNAAMQLVTNRDYLSRSRGEELPRVRITNSADATVEQFQLSWADADPTTAASKPLPVYVPPGHNIVTRVPGEPNSITGRKLVLTGDDQTFDNTLYLAPNLDRQINILYMGNDNHEDPEKMLYYVRRAFQPAGRFKPHIASEQANGSVRDEGIQTADLIIVTDSINPQSTNSLRQVMEAGGTILLVMNSANATATIAALAGLDQINCEEAKVDEYAMLGPIEFEHPLLSAFSEPRFGDFTKIHFWKYRKTNIDNIPKVRILARFDNGDPALFELPLGRGSLLVLTSGWNPSDSQLALSSKFVPLLYSMLEYNGVFDGQQSQYFVGDSILIPHPRTTGPANLQIRKPDNSLIDLDPGRQNFDQTELPGIYTIESAHSTSPSGASSGQAAGKQFFAVNISPQECRTAPLSLDELEQFGIPFQGASNVLGEKILKARQESSLVEMEHQQRLWRWLLIALLVVLIVETWLAGWLTRPAVTSQGEEK
jgi:hypothetical protein